MNNKKQARGEYRDSKVPGWGFPEWLITEGSSVIMIALKKKQHFRETILLHVQCVPKEANSIQSTMLHSYEPLHYQLIKSNKSHSTCTKSFPINLRSFIKQQPVVPHCWMSKSLNKCHDGNNWVNLCRFDTWWDVCLKLFLLLCTINNY